MAAKCQGSHSEGLLKPGWAIATRHNPLGAQASLNENLVHSARYHFTDGSRQQQTAHARVFCPLGLSANDELFLWGLLSLTLS